MSKLKTTNSDISVLKFIFVYKFFCQSLLFLYYISIAGNTLQF